MSHVTHFIIELKDGQNNTVLHQSDPDTFQGILNNYKTKDGNNVAMYSVTDADLSAFKRKHPDSTKDFPDDFPDQVKKIFAQTCAYIDMSLKEFYNKHGLQQKFKDIIQTKVMSIDGEDARIAPLTLRLDSGGEMTVEYIASGVSGAVYSFSVAFQGKVYEYAVKIQEEEDERDECYDPDDDRPKIEWEYLSTMSDMAESGTSHTAWLIDSYREWTKIFPNIPSSATNTLFLIMMKADGVIYDLIKDSKYTDEQRLVAIKYALVSLYMFHKVGTHGDAHGGNYFYFNKRMKATSVDNGVVSLPESDFQVVLYDPGLAGSKEKGKYDQRFGLEAINEEDHLRVVPPVERMSLDYRQTLSACNHYMKRTSYLSRILTKAGQHLEITDYEGKASPSGEMIRDCFSFLDGNTSSKKRRRVPLVIVDDDSDGDGDGDGDW